MDPEHVQSLVEMRIREAQERGDFDNLPGAGKKLASIDRPYTEDWWVQSLIEREELDVIGATNPTMALRRERAQMRDTVRDVPREESVREIVDDYNRRVKLDRLRPATGPQMPPIAKTLDVETVLEQWRIDRVEVEEQERAAREEAAALAARAERERRENRWWRRMLR